MRKNTVVTLAVAGLCALGLLIVQAAEAKKKKPEIIEAYSARVISTVPDQTQRVRLSIYDWTTDGERAMLIQELKENDQQGFQAILSKQDVKGTFQAQKSVAYPVRYIKKFADPNGGYRIVAATDRRLDPREVVGTDPRGDYLFAIMEIAVDAEGKAQAVVSPNSKLHYDDERNVVKLENWQGQLLGLNDVKQTK